MTDKEKIKFWAKGRLFEIMNGIGENDAKNILTDLLSLIDSMQEEPKSKCKGCNNVKGCIACVDGSEWAHIEESKECMYSKDNYTDEDRKFICKGCEEECRFNKKEELVSKEPKFKQGDILYNVSDGSKIEIIDIVADQYKFECGDEYPHYDFFGYIESNYSKYPISEDLDDYAKEILSWEDSHKDWDRLVIRKTAKHFTAWQKQQMIKDAVDGKIYETQARSKLKAATIGKISGLKYRVGDKVKLIILKEK